MGQTYKEIVDALGCAKSTVSYHCGAGQVDKTRGRQRDARNKKRVYIQEVKSTSCCDCGENYPYWVMDFDHRGGKSFNIGNSLSTYSFEDVIAEISKCDVVCSNCHRDRTHARLIRGGFDSPSANRLEYNEIAVG